MVESSDGARGRDARGPDADEARTIAQPLAADIPIPHVDRADAFRRAMSLALDGAYRRAAVLLGDCFESEGAVRRCRRTSLTSVELAP